jgi:hypothetical protein
MGWLGSLLLLIAGISLLIPPHSRSVEFALACLLDELQSDP